MAFDGATGWLVGDQNRGLQAMFVDDERGAPARGAAGTAHAQNVAPATPWCMRTNVCRAGPVPGQAGADP